MFFSRHLYIVILCYVLLILGVAGTGLVLIVTHTGIIIGCLIIIISFFITGALVKRLNKSNAKLKLFFDAIEDKENMIQFNEYSGDREMNALSRSLNRINELLATAKSDSQKQEKFYYSLLEEIPKSRKTKCDGCEKRNAIFFAKTKCTPKIPVTIFSVKLSGRNTSVVQTPFENYLNDTFY